MTNRNIEDTLRVLVSDCQYQQNYGSGKRRVLSLKKLETLDLETSLTSNSKNNNGLDRHQFKFWKLCVWNLC